MMAHDRSKTAMSKTGMNEQGMKKQGTSKQGVPAQSMCDCLRLLRGAAGVVLACFASIAVAQSAQQEVSGAAASAEVSGNTAPAMGSSTPMSSFSPMSSGDLVNQLSGVKDNSLVIANKYISGPLTLRGDQRPIAPVTFKVEFRDCEFADDVVVRQVNFAQSVTLLNVKFDKGLDIEHVYIKGDLQLDNVHASEMIKLNQTQVDGDVRIKDPVATGLQVENLTANNLIVSLGKGFASQPGKTPSKGSVPSLDFARLTAGRFSLSAASELDLSNVNLSLTSANLKETLVLLNLDLQEVIAEDLIVSKRVLFLSPTTIRKRLDLTSANLGGFEWRFAGPVRFPEKVEINGATFGSLAIVRVPSTGAAASAELRADRNDYGLAFLEKGEYYEPAYTSYESSLKIRGQSDKADAVYFAMRDRRRYTEFRDANTLWQKTVAGFNYVIGFGHKWLFGYGRGWVYPLIWSVLFVLAGSFIFRTEYMEKVDEQSSHGFSPIWYSLDIFVPVLSLGIAKDWHPRQERRLLQFYSKFLSLIGLIFISAMIGALTGTLK